MGARVSCPKERGYALYRKTPGGHQPISPFSGECQMVYFTNDEILAACMDHMDAWVATVVCVPIAGACCRRILSVEKMVPVAEFVERRCPQCADALRERVQTWIAMIREDETNQIVERLDEVEKEISVTGFEPATL